MSAAHSTRSRWLRPAFLDVVPDVRVCPLPQQLEDLARRARLTLAQIYSPTAAGAQLVDQIGAVLVPSLSLLIVLRGAADHEAEEIRERARGWLSELDARADLELERRRRIGGGA